jgi:UDP-N-acetylmuramoyl-L-alanyl-D-glutamate--2,6-diaminopimelate ligase
MIQKLKNLYHLLQAVIANMWYGFPSRYIKVIGVTGTDGKTTTTHLLYHILSTAGKKVSMISTIYGMVGNKEYDTGLHVTTPDPFMVQKMIRDAVEYGDEYFVLETTSHAIDQNRTWGIKYRGAVLTNITHEHLDYHHTIEEYANIKWSLVEKAQIALVNKDDEVTNQIIKGQKSKIKNLKTYGLNSKADYMRDFRSVIPDLANFNAYNYLGAYGLCRELGISEDMIISALQTFKLPAGRIDIVHNNKFKVIVDFAHTPNGIARILETVRSQYVKDGGKLIHVFGSAGLRDHLKRPKMGEASAEFADVSIITEEDYRTEDPHTIANEIGKGFAKWNKKYSVIADREKAIHAAINQAQEHDVVVITGKGHEKSLCRGKIEYPWSDIECVKSYVSHKR